MRNNFCEGPRCTFFHSVASQILGMSPLFRNLALNNNARQAKYLDQQSVFSSNCVNTCANFRFNILRIELELVKSFMLTPAAKPTAKYAHEGELFARMDLTSDISEDTSHGRLILQNAHTVLIAPAAADTADKSPDNNLPDKVLCG